MSDMPAVDKAKAAMRERGSANLQSKGANPTGCSNSPKVPNPKGNAEYKRSHPDPYRK
jgi:hypothetical protein